ncbi:MAG: ABC transporter ATP-binding protein [Clostridia bacterium]|nr:ABC transporter ATP-binding protein [Clostridia bacterium]
MKKEILRFRDVKLVYHTLRGETIAVENLTFSLKEGEFIAVIGPSGCGKTTLLSLAAGLLPPSDGEVLNDGLSFGYMLQKDELFPWRTIEKNIFLPLEIKKINTAENRERVKLLAEKYGLSEFLHSYPSQLSGGMRQRAALIRTLATNPDVLLLDEPFSALDYQTRLNVTEDVSQIIRSERKTALLITHDISEAISLADRVLVLSARPATVRFAHELDFGDVVNPLKRREERNFSAWFERLWRELNG